MSNSQSTHNGCLELFRRSEPLIWDHSTSPKVSNNYVKHVAYCLRSAGRSRHSSIWDHSTSPKVSNNYVKHHPAYCPQSAGRSRHRKPYLRVEANNDDFLYLANHLIATAKDTPRVMHDDTICVAQSNLITNNPIEKSDWVVLENMLEHEWDFVHVRKNLQPSYADIVMRNRQKPKDREMIMQIQKCSKTKQTPSKVEQDSYMNIDDNLASSEDTWFYIKCETAKSYHRKIEFKRKKRRDRQIGHEHINLEREDRYRGEGKHAEKQ